MFDSQNSHQIEDLKIELLEIKKENIRVKRENEELKVKIRKLQESMTRKHKMIDELIDPTKSSTNTFRRDVSEFGASIVLTLREDNEKLLSKISEKEEKIRKLQNELDASKAYIRTKTRSSTARSKSQTKKEIRPPSILSQNSCSRLSTRRSISEDRTKSKLPIKIHHGQISKILSHSDLTIVKTDIPGLYTTCDDPKNNDMQHEEIQQIQNYFKDIINEVKTLKESICLIRKEQEKSEEKNDTLEKLINVKYRRNNTPKIIHNANTINYKLKPDVVSVPKADNELWSSSSEDNNFGLVPKPCNEKKEKRRQYKVISTNSCNKHKESDYSHLNSFLEDESCTMLGIENV